MHHGTPALRVAIAEDHALLRNGLVLQLESAGVTVTRACESADELLTHVYGDDLDVIILDIQLPPTRSDEGIRAAKTIRRELPHLGILVLSMYVEPAYADAVVSIGTTGIGYLVKDRVTSITALLDALTRIRRGECVIDPEVVQALICRPRHRSTIDSLTTRERSVLQLMAEGRSNASIAAELSLAVRTIEANTAAIFDKLDLTDHPGANRRVQAVLAWLQGHEPQRA